MFTHHSNNLLLQNELEKVRRAHFMRQKRSKDNHTSSDNPPCPSKTTAYRHSNHGNPISSSTEKRLVTEALQSWVRAVPETSHSKRTNPDGNGRSQTSNFSFYLKIWRRKMKPKAGRMEETEMRTGMDGQRIMQEQSAKPTFFKLKKKMCVNLVAWTCGPSYLGG